MDSFDSKYDDNKRDGIIYRNFVKYDDEHRKLFRIEAVTDVGKTYTSIQSNFNQESINFDIKKEIKLYESDMGQQKYWCWLIQSDDENKINGLHLCRRTSKGNVYNNQEITLNPYGIQVLKEFLNNIEICEDTISSKTKLEIDDNKNGIVTTDEMSKIIDENLDSIDDYFNLIDLKKKNKAIERLEKIVNGDYKNESKILKGKYLVIWFGIFLLC